MFAVETLELNLKKSGHPVHPKIQEKFLDELHALPPDARVKKLLKRKVQLDQCTSTTPITGAGGAPALSAREQGLYHQPAAVKLEASEFKDAHNSVGVKRKVRNLVVAERIPRVKRKDIP